jgi:nucleoside-diphosphate-sugar epimerase
MKTISILGCGWLGSPLARNLLAEGYTVKGSTTSAEKLSVMRDVGITPFRLKLSPEPEPPDTDDFFDTDLLIIDIPPKTRTQGEDFHPRQISAVTGKIKQHGIPHCIYISSTSVYPNLEKEVNEEDAPEANEGATTESSQAALLGAEQILKETTDLALTIVRCGGLMGYDRIPGKYFTGKKDLSTGSIPVNYIHRDDVIGIVLEVIRQNCWSQVFNAVAPQHPTRREVYEQNAREFGFEAPTFTDAPSKDFKIVSPAKLQTVLGYKFRYPNPLAFRYSKP